MLDATLYLVCVDPKTREVVPGVNSCSMCKRLIINAGISTVIIRNTPEEFTTVNVESWIENDDSMSGAFGY